MSQLPLIATLGAGRMGRGIAHAFAYAGHEVLLIDVKARSAAATATLEREALAEIDASLASLASLGAFDDAERAGVMARITFAGRDQAPAALARTEVLFEGVPEVREAKVEALAYACAHLPATAIIASTTSSFLVSMLAPHVCNAERFLNAHWLNPAYLIPLVELSPHAGTEPEALQRLKSILEGIGKVPVVCAAAPGYIVPRLQSLIMNEAARMIEEGVASAQDIDLATRYGFGFRYAAMGVVEFIDYGGNDILFYASRYLAGALGERYASPPIVERYMREGRNGLSTGQGFYDYTQRDVAVYRREALARLLAMLRHQALLMAPNCAAEAMKSG